MTQTAWLGLLGALLWAGLSAGATVRPRAPERNAVDPYGITTFVDRFEGKKRACVVAVGDGSSYMGLYVFDRWGNCVAKDDASEVFATRDDLAVEWYPAETAEYTIDVRNFGSSRNIFNISIR